MRLAISAIHRRYGGVTSRLRVQLVRLGWHPSVHRDEVADTHADGRSFDLVTLPIKVMDKVLLQSWLERVATEVLHRKFCQGLTSIDYNGATLWKKYPIADRVYLLSQLTGVTYTRDCLAHVRGAEISHSCPRCGELDSRLHRVRYCPFTEQLRRPFLQGLQDREIPDSAWAYGLWPELDSLRIWQVCLSDIAWPTTVRTSSPQYLVLFTDGSCLYPKVSELRLAAGAVICASSRGTFDVVWQGPLPTLAQSIFRAEVLALGVAVGSVQRATIFCDNLQAVRIAQRLLSLPPAHRAGAIPSDHRDVWFFFVMQATPLLVGCVDVKWTPSHRDWRSLSGPERHLAFFNAKVDLVAKSEVRQLAGNPTFQTLVCHYEQRRFDVGRLADLHVAVAKFFGGLGEPARPLLDLADFHTSGVWRRLRLTDMGVQVHAGFSVSLRGWLTSLRWFETSAGGLRQTSPLELLWQYIEDCGALPPFWFDGAWRFTGDDVSFQLVVPSLSCLYRAWCAALRQVSWDGDGVVVPAPADSCRALGLAFGDWCFRAVCSCLVWSLMTFVYSWAVPGPCIV